MDSTGSDFTNSPTPSQKEVWLQELKKGDVVILTERAQQTIRTVTRVTPKQVFVNIGNIKEYECAFWKKNGCQVGHTDSWSYAPYISTPTDQAVQSIRNTQELRDLKEWMGREIFNLTELRAIRSVVLDIRDKALATKQ